MNGVDPNQTEHTNIKRVMRAYARKHGKIARRMRLKTKTSMANLKNKTETCEKKNTSNTETETESEPTESEPTENRIRISDYTSAGKWLWLELHKSLH